jgi:hypothetical protein
MLRRPTRLWIAFAILAVSALCCTDRAAAVFVLKKGAAKPLLGYLVRQDAATVIVREPLQEGGFSEQAIPREDIEELIITVEPERLETLDPKEPGRYREYAEELIEKQRDPEAREAALRLLHIAAWHSDGSLRKSALLGMVSLARTPEEQRRFRAAAYLHDPEHDRSLLAEVGELPTVRGTAQREPLTDLLAAVRALRQGMVGEARSIFERPVSKDGLESLTSFVTRDELIAACGARQLSSDQLRKVLLAEVALSRALNERAAESAEKSALSQTSWSQAVQTGGLAPLPSIDLLSLTEFDPRECLFRGGKWIKQ